MQTQPGEPTGAVEPSGALLPLPLFAAPQEKAQLEEGNLFTPNFDGAGLVVCVTTEQQTGAVLMVATMNVEALRQTLETGIVHYWSRSRKVLWRKGDTSGQVQRLVEMRTDCDQDTLLLTVAVGGDGGACHTGRHSCFYRRVVTSADGGVRLQAIDLRSEGIDQAPAAGGARA